MINICKKITDYVSASPHRLTQRDIIREMSRQFSAPRKEINAALRSLLEASELVYSYIDGHSFVEASLEKAVRITERVVLKPPNISYQLRSNEVLISIQSGASFGSGSHPTTRLALGAIEFALSKASFFRKTRALDIGTGSGVLAIAAVMMGIDAAIGIDIDPCARAEAAENVRLNQLEKQIDIRDQDIETISDKFALILANLRYPTLKSLYPKITALTETGGIVVVSGIHEDELSDLLSCYAPNFVCEWQKSEKNWSAAVFQKK
jgi:ribosomal protein L11 methyltransferase